MATSDHFTFLAAQASLEPLNFVYILLFTLQEDKFQGVFIFIIVIVFFF